jgi:hypothetical protein
LRDDDPKDRIYFLVVGVCPTYEIKGWIRGGEGMLDRFVNDYGDYGKAYFVPESFLNKITEMEGYI